LQENGGVAPNYQQERVISLPDVQGNLSGIRKTTLEILESLHKAAVPPGKPSAANSPPSWPSSPPSSAAKSPSISTAAAKWSASPWATPRTVGLPDAAGRRTAHRLSGIRCIHTHPYGDSELSALDLTSLKELRFDLVAALGVDAQGEVSQVSFAFIAGWNGEEGATIETVGRCRPTTSSPWTSPPDRRDRPPPRGPRQSCHLSY
jgi:GTP-binding protein HflX